jgi:hypothetical protein
VLLGKGAGPAPAVTGVEARKNVGSGNARSSKSHLQTSQVIRADLIGTNLRWRCVGTGWHLFLGRRFFGAVIPDSKHPGMWRSPLASGCRSDMANMSWTRHAVFEGEIRELQWEAQHDHAITPPKCPENEGVFGTTSPPVRQNGAALGHPREATK